MRDPSYSQSEPHAEPARPARRLWSIPATLRRPDLSLSRLNWTHAVISLPLIGIVLVFVIFGTLITHGTASIPANSVILPVMTSGPTAAPLITIKPWDGQHRLTVLVMGSDEDTGRGETLYSSQMDMIMLFSLDPATHGASILSVPRDLFMPLPGKPNMQQINTVVMLGELDQQGTGTKLLMQTLQYNLGIPINNYAVISFPIVTTLIDAVGGVDINVPVAIDDPLFPGPNFTYDPLYIPAGMVHMDGTLALKYARTRHDNSDFQRTLRQQQILLAVREKVMRLNMLPQLIQQAPSMWTQLQGNFSTDLSLGELLSLITYARGIDPSAIHHASIDGQYVLPIQTDNGDTILTPDRAKLADLMTSIFGKGYAQ